MEVRPIDANALLQVPSVNRVVEYDETGCGMAYLAVPVQAIKGAPTLDYAPVRHALWKYEGHYKACSICGSFIHAEATLGSRFWKYCPKCGAKMDGGKEDG